jgi:hypothetical protein
MTQVLEKNWHWLWSHQISPWLYTGLERVGFTVFFAELYRCMPSVHSGDHSSPEAVLRLQDCDAFKTR